MLDTANPGKCSLAAVRGWPLDELEMSTRLRNCLRSQGFERVGDLEGKTERDFLRVQNFGSGCLRELLQLMQKLQVGIGLQTRANIMGRTIWWRLFKHPLLQLKLTEDERWQIFCDVAQPR